MHLRLSLSRFGCFCYSTCRQGRNDGRKVHNCVEIFLPVSYIHEETVGRPRRFIAVAALANSKIIKVSRTLGISRIHKKIGMIIVGFVKRFSCLKSGKNTLIKYIYWFASSRCVAPSLFLIRTSLARTPNRE